MNVFGYVRLVIKDELVELKEILIEHRWLVLFLLSITVTSFMYLRPFPPATVLLAAGSQGNSYWMTGQAAARYFETNGVELKLMETSGSIENAQLLSDPARNIAIALIQGGALDNIDTKNMQSLGSIGYEPLWIFYRKSLPSPPRNFSDLTQLRIGIGPLLGGTQKLFRDVLALNGINLSELKGIDYQSYQDDTRDFLDGKLDAVVKVDNYSDPDIQKLLNDQRFSIMPVPHTAAYEKNLSYVHALTLPASAVDIAKNIPAADVPLIGTTTSLVVDKDLHPDIQMLLLVAARDLQRSSQSLFFSKRGEFPAYVDPTIDISPVAAQYYDHGAPQSLHYLPFWLAGFLSRIWIVALTIIAFAYPISKLNLHLRETRYHMKHHAIYEQLLEIEKTLCEKEMAIDDLIRLDDHLRRINREAIKIRVPTGAEAKYFDLLNAINLLQNKIKDCIGYLKTTYSNLAKTS